MWLWIALFTLPFMYRACRHALDALVEETLLFVAEVVRGGEAMPRSPAQCNAQVHGARYCQPQILGLSGILSIFKRPVGVFLGGIGVDCLV